MQETWVHSPGQEDPPEKGHGNLLQYFCLENSIQRGLVGYSPWGCKESDTTEQLTHSLHFYDRMNPETQALAVSPWQTQEENANLDSQAQCLFPHTTSFLKSVQRCPKYGGSGWRAIFPLGTEVVPPSLPICALGSAQVCHGSTQDASDFPTGPNNVCEGHPKKCEEHMYEWMQRAWSCQPLCFPGPGPPQVGASSYPRRQRETWSSRRELGHKCRRNTFLTDISRLFHNRQTASHMQSLTKKQKVQVWIACVYVLKHK